MITPYFEKDISQWLDITKVLIDEHPLDIAEIVEVTLTSWKQIFDSRIGPLSIGEQIFPSPQIMSNILHELIPYNLTEKFGRNYRIGNSKNEKDIVYTPDLKYSIEVKASSSKNDIYANRSYAQPMQVLDGKNKDGYYIAVNFEKFKINSDGEYKSKIIDINGLVEYPSITLIKFGYLEHTDWIPQKSSKGQQARLSVESKRNKLLTIYCKE